ncbi:uncharacterized protein LOC143888776 [Tasmannia lanceolata]|uniref:uncharacterized protein LOC143888776 n=1 Tax=Tasmannia lanceolata TaxID=3420 RepID=UPI004062980D
MELGGNDASKSATMGGSVQTRFTRLEFPRFDGLEDPTGWVYRAEQFFRFHQTAEDMKVPLSSFHLESEALQWFQWYEKVHKNMEWNDLKIALCVRFGPTEFDNFDSALSKLRQTSTVREYQKEFEKLSNIVEGWTEKALIGTFVGGLKDELAGEVQVFRPKTLNDAIGLARMMEEKIQYS